MANAFSTTPVAPPTPTGATPTFAAGLLADQQTLSDWLAQSNFSIIAGQTGGTPTDLVRRVQSALSQADARVTATLAVLQSATSTFFNVPLAVGGVAPRLAPDSIAGGLLLPIAHQLAGKKLNEWRMIQSDSSGNSADAVQGAMVPVQVRATNWQKTADADLARIVRWAWGYSDGLAVPDLDRAADAEVGLPVQRVVVPATSPAGQRDGCEWGYRPGIGYGWW